MALAWFPSVKPVASTQDMIEMRRMVEDLTWVMNTVSEELVNGKRSSTAPTDVVPASPAKRKSTGGAKRKPKKRKVST